MTMTETRGQDAGNVPAAALKALDPEDFSSLVLASLGPETDPAVWDALTDPLVITRTKQCLGSIHADLQTQLARANTELDEIRADCLGRGDTGKQEYFDARAAQSDWRHRTAGFRRLVERRMAFVKSRAASMIVVQPKNPPGYSQRARKHTRASLELLARAIAEHQRRVTSGDGDEDDDETLWRTLTEVTAIVASGQEMPLTEWLEYLDDTRES
jgi:hypothetical protein